MPLRGVSLAILTEVVVEMMVDVVVDGRGCDKSSRKRISTVCVRLIVGHVGLGCVNVGWVVRAILDQLEVSGA